MPDSSTGGYLIPKPSPALVPAEDAAFRAFIQALLVGLTGLDEDSGVRESWQAIPAPIPQPSENWMAFSARAIPSENEPDEEQLDAGGMVQTTQESVEVLISSYGPAAHAYATRVRDGFHVEQNRAGMYSAGVGLTSVGRLLHVPENRSGKWYDRWDLTLVLSREVRREYAQLHFLGAAGEVVASRGGEPVLTEEWTVSDE